MSDMSEKLLIEHSIWINLRSVKILKEIIKLKNMYNPSYIWIK